MQEMIYKVAVFCSLCVYSIVRYYYSRKYLKSGDSEKEYPVYTRTLFIIGGTWVVIIPLGYVFTDFLEIFAVDLPEGIRLFGIVLYSLANLTMWWVLHVLGPNFSEINENRQLVTTGPYKYVRHPMYTGFIVFAFAHWIVSSNWFIGIGVIVVSLLTVLRIPIEEKMLIQEYGKEYRLYCSQTDRLIPKIL